MGRDALMIHRNRRSGRNGLSRAMLRRPLLLQPIRDKICEHTRYRSHTEGTQRPCLHDLQIHDKKRLQRTGEMLGLSDGSELLTKTGRSEYVIRWTSAASPRGSRHSK